MRLRKRPRFSGPLRALPSSNSRRWTDKLADVIVYELSYRRPALIKAQSSASTISSMAAGGVVLPAQPWTSAGLRVPLARGSAKDKDFEKVALQLNPATGYPKTGHPDEKELAGICNYRFRYLQNFARGECEALGQSIDPLLEQNMGLCRHPTPAAVAAALGVVSLFQKRKGRNFKAMANAWSGRLKAFKKSVGRDRLTATPEFERHCGPLIKRMGVVGAVIFVLEQALEFERTCDYVKAHLKLFRDTCAGRSKAFIFADLEPVLLFADVFGIGDITVGDPDNLARVAADFLKPLRAARHRADAPEGLRYHSIMGFSPLDFLLIYFFSCHQRFADVAAPQNLCPFSLNSAFLRLALNVLAHLDVDEAHAEVVARLSHAPQSLISEEPDSNELAASAAAPATQAKPRPKSERAAQGRLGRVIQRKAFDLFQPAAESPLHEFLYDDPDWGAPWVNELRKRYGALSRRGLHDEQKNPFARAFPLPEAWSSERSTDSLDRWFGALTDEVSRLDPRYSPIVGKTGKSATKMKLGGLMVALELSAAMVEVPNAISLSKSFAIAPKGVGSALAKAKHRRPPVAGKQQRRTKYSLTQKKPKTYIIAT